MEVSVSQYDRGVCLMEGFLLLERRLSSAVHVEMFVLERCSFYGMSILRDSALYYARHILNFMDLAAFSQMLRSCNGWQSSNLIDSMIQILLDIENTKTDMPLLKLNMFSEIWPGNLIRLVKSKEGKHIPKCFPGINKVLSDFSIGNLVDNFISIDSKVLLCFIIDICML